MTEQPLHDARCAVCEKKYYFHEIKNCKSCPNCGTIISPVLISDDVTVTLNWRDIRVLVNYAKRWVAGFDKSDPLMNQAITAFGNIERKLKKHRPNGAPTFIADEKVNAMTVNGVPKVLPDGSVLSPFQCNKL